MSLNQNRGFRSGDWHALCAYCGLEYYASELRQDWMGHYACPKDFTLRNPQDFRRAVPETEFPEFVRPDNADGEITVEQMINNVPSTITASLTDLAKAYVTNTAGTFVLSIPAANDATYGIYSVLLRIELIGSLSSTYKSITSITPTSGTLVGSQTIVAGTIAWFRNNPTTNTWTRER